MSRSDALALAAAFAGGAILGAAAGLLFAPAKGEDPRAKIMEALEKRGVKLSKESFNKLVEEIKNIGRKRKNADGLEVVPAEDFDVE